MVTTVIKMKMATMAKGRMERMGTSLQLRKVVGHGAPELGMLLALTLVLTTMRGCHLPSSETEPLWAAERNRARRDVCRS